jgi:hypothetical protein
LRPDLDKTTRLRQLSHRIGGVISHPQDGVIMPTKTTIARVNGIELDLG